MEKKYEKVYHSIEDKFWWFVGRRHTIHAILNKIPVGARILDIGCSSGRLLYELHSDHTIETLGRASMLHAGRPTVVLVGAGARPIDAAQPPDTDHIPSPSKANLST